MVQIDNRVLCMVAHHNEEASLILLHAIAYECLDARISAGEVGKVMLVGKHCHKREKK